MQATNWKRKLRTHLEVGDATTTGWILSMVSLEGMPEMIHGMVDGDSNMLEKGGYFAFASQWKQAGMKGGYVMMSCGIRESRAGHLVQEMSMISFPHSLQPHFTEGVACEGRGQACGKDSAPHQESLPTFSIRYSMHMAHCIFQIIHSFYF